MIDCTLSARAAVRVVSARQRRCGRPDHLLEHDVVEHEVAGLGLHELELHEAHG